MVQIIFKAAHADNTDAAVETSGNVDFSIPAELQAEIDDHHIKNIIWSMITLIQGVSVFFLTIFLRRKVRHIRSIKGNICYDFFAVLFCNPCVTCQMAAEVGEDDMQCGELCDFPSGLKANGAVIV